MSHSSGPVTHSDSSSTSPPLRLLCSGHTCLHSVNEQHTCSPSLQSSPGTTFTSSTLAPPRQAMLPFATQDFLMLSAWCSSHSLPYGLPLWCWTLVFQTGSHVCTVSRRYKVLPQGRDAATAALLDPKPANTVDQGKPSSTDKISQISFIDIA